MAVPEAEPSECKNGIGCRIKSAWCEGAIIVIVVNMVRGRRSSAIDEALSDFVEPFRVNV